MCVCVCCVCVFVYVCVCVCLCVRGLCVENQGEFAEQRFTNRYSVLAIADADLLILMDFEFVIVNMYRGKICMSKF